MPRPKPPAGLLYDDLSSLAEWVLSLSQKDWKRLQQVLLVVATRDETAATICIELCRMRTLQEAA